MKEIGYGKDYKYSHEYEEHVADMECLPPSLVEKRYYLPSNQGLESEYGQRLEHIMAVKRKRRQNKLEEIKTGKQVTVGETKKEYDLAPPRRFT